MFGTTSSVRTGFVAIFARTDCPECGSAVIINRLCDALHCRSCESAIPVPMTYWDGLFFRLFEAFPNGMTFSLTLSTGLMSELPLFARFRAEMPACSACDAPLPLVQPIGYEGTILCARCQHPTRTFPRPQWIPAQFAALQQFFEPVESVAPLSDKTVAFACQECGGKLRLQAGMRRVTECQYCKATMFLPAELWHALHPVEKRRAWWVAVSQRVIE